MEPSSPSGPGGFLPATGLLSPSPSQVSSAHSHRAPGLPHPRRNPLRPGSSKEDLVRRHVEARMLHISRRYVKKFGLTEPDDEVVGYKSMAELCRDVDELLNVLWLSGTPSLQIPYLLNLAGELITWVGGFPPAPRATLALLRKLDHCFASLMEGTDIDTGESLPGLASGQLAGMTRTDMVRCRSTAELTRVAVVEVMSRAPAEGEEQEPSQSGGGDVDKGEDTVDEEEDEEEELHMDVARVYEQTIVKLGEILGDGGGRIGEPMITDDI